MSKLISTLMALALSTAGMAHSENSGRGSSGDSRTPRCNSGHIGNIIFDESLNSFRICSSFGWSILTLNDLRGPAGPAGLTGETGPRGLPGINGELGAQGPIGSQGIQGQIGPQGIIGLTGEKGDSGPRGLPGLNGEAGLHGAKGDTGEMGPQGLVGATGPVGPSGDQGEKGDVGPRGLPGLVGATGPQGPAGIIGPNSVDSSHIVNGSITSEDIGTLSNLNVGALNATGIVKIGHEARACDPQLAGGLRFNLGKFEGCDGVSWRELSMVVSNISKQVFITSNLYNGNQLSTAFADNACQTSASNSGLSGTFKAWLSDGPLMPSNRMTRASGSYLNTRGQAIASNWNDLTDGSLQTPILYDENSQDTSSFPWIATNTSPAGTFVNTSCSSTNSITFGSSVLSSGHWTQYGVGACNSNYRMLCIEQ